MMMPFCHEVAGTVGTHNQALDVPTQTYDLDLASSPQVSLNPPSRPATIAAPVKELLFCLKVCIHVCTCAYMYVGIVEPLLITCLSRSDSNPATKLCCSTRARCCFTTEGHKPNTMGLGNSLFAASGYHHPEQILHSLQQSPVTVTLGSITCFKKAPQEDVTLTLPHKHQPTHPPTTCTDSHAHIPPTHTLP